MPRIYLPGTEPKPEEKVNVESIWNNIESYRGNHDILKYLFEDLDYPSYAMVTNGEWYVTRNVHGVTKKVIFHLYSTYSWTGSQKYIKPSKVVDK
jgi:hypothetical protein